MSKEYFDIIFKTPRKKYNLELKRNVIKCIENTVNRTSEDFLYNLIDIINKGGIKYDVLMDSEIKEPVKLSASVVADICRKLGCTYEELTGAERINEYNDINNGSSKLDFRTLYKNDVEIKKGRETFAKMLKQRYQSLGFPTARAFAKEAGISESTVSSILNLRNTAIVITARTMKLICSTLHCTQDYLLGNVFDPNNYSNPTDKTSFEQGTLVFLEDSNSVRRDFVYYIKNEMRKKEISDEKMRIHLQISEEDYEKILGYDRLKVTIPKNTLEKICEKLGMTMEELEENIGFVFPAKNPENELRPLYSRIEYPLRSWLFVEYQAGHINKEMERLIKALVKTCHEQPDKVKVIKTFLEALKK